MRSVNEVILVNETDDEIGTMEKLAAHQTGALHRAISVFIYNSKGEMLIQKRAKTKYHSAGLWSNACCSHPYPGESTLDASNRRLMEEIGLDCSLNFSHSFLYKVPFNNGLTEYEFDHVFIGTTDNSPTLNHEEASEVRYVDIEKLKQEMESKPDSFSYWFKLIMKDLHP